jgi:hypothetical protein
MIIQTPWKNPKDRKAGLRILRIYNKREKRKWIFKNLVFDFCNGTVIAPVIISR